MSIAASLLPEFDHEMANTRRTLERVPDSQWDWKPHPKSYPLGTLASHMTELLIWMKSVLDSEAFDFAPKDGPRYQRVPRTNRTEILEFFDQNLAECRKLLAGTSDERMMQTWSLLNGGNAVFAMPRITVLRGFIFNHMVHHRAQMGVYFRLLDISVPAIYGPSADEQA